MCPVFLPREHADHGFEKLRTNPHRNLMVNPCKSHRSTGQNEADQSHTPPAIMKAGGSDQLNWKSRGVISSSLKKLVLPLKFIKPDILGLSEIPDSLSSLTEI